MAYPDTRMRRLRKSDSIRRLVCEASFGKNDLVYPLFVCPGNNIKKPVKSMEGCFHFSPDRVAEEAREVFNLEIPAVLLFGIARKKDQRGSDVWKDDAIVQQAIRHIKEKVPELLVITDLCLCAYTSHGHCGVLEGGKILNDQTCGILAKAAVSHARVGADMVAPSDMMDGRVGYIRKALDKNGYSDTGIMAYSAKFASAFYGPFRDVADSAPSFGDRKTYQIDPANSDQALRHIQMDVEQGADIVMVKPALCFLDVISRAASSFNVPLATYNVSGEYMMIQSAAQSGLIDRDQAILESLTSIKRAGADIIITYFAKDVARLLG